VRLSWYDPPPGVRPGAGERWRVSARLRQPRGLRNPGGFDREHRALREGVCAAGYVRDEVEPRRVQRAGAGLDALREETARRVDRRLQGSPAGGIVKALVVGVRDGVSAEQRQLLQRTGTAHLMAISGLHVGLVAGMALVLGRLLAARCPAAVALRPAADWGAMSALLAAATYAALAGFSLPTQRALVMLASVLLGTLLRRRAGRTRALALALSLVLLLDPLAIVDAGTWLSFAAVAGLLWALSDIDSRHGIAAGVRTAVRVQVAACLAVLPVTVLCFAYQSVTAPLCNLLAVPVTGLIVVPLALSGTLLDFLSPQLGAPILRLAAHVMTLLLDALAAAPLSGQVLVTAAAPGPAAVIMGLLGAALLLVPVPRATRCLGAAWLAPLLIPPPGAPAPGELWLQVLDVGQGLAAVVRTQSRTLVFDAGPAWGSGAGAGAWVVAPALMRQGVRQVDVLVLSHAHADHAAGARGLLRSIEVRRVVGDGTRVERPVVACTPQLSWRWDGYRFQFLHPPAPGRRGNDASCVLRISGPGGSYLLPADLESRGERELLAHAGTELRADVLLVPHHGSATSSSAEFLDAVAPQFAIVASGHRNRFHFPARPVVRRYRARGVQLYDTACNGQIQVRLAPGRPPALRAWDHDGMRFWHSRDRGAHCDAGPARAS
jgi:competence protein ComEC